MYKISGPLLDRIELRMEAQNVPFQDLVANTEGSPSADMREQVLRAPAAQHEGFDRDSQRLKPDLVCHPLPARSVRCTLRCFASLARERGLLPAAPFAGFSSRRSRGFGWLGLRLARRARGCLGFRIGCRLGTV